MTTTHSADRSEHSAPATQGAPMDPPGRFRAAEWVLVGIAMLLVVLGCAKGAQVDSTDPQNAAPPASQISGELGTTVNRVVGGLDPKQKDCIQREGGGPAAAAANCVDRSVLAKEVVDQVKAMGIADEAFLACVQKSVEALSNADLDKLAGGASQEAMSRLGGDIANCLGTSRPSSRQPTGKFSSVGSAIR